MAADGLLYIFISSNLCKYNGIPITNLTTTIHNISN